MEPTPEFVTHEVSLVVSIRLDRPMDLSVSPLNSLTSTPNAEAGTTDDPNSDSSLNLLQISPDIALDSGDVWQNLLSLVGSLDGAVKVINELAKVMPFLESIGARSIDVICRFIHTCNWLGAYCR